MRGQYTWLWDLDKVFALDLEHAGRMGRHGESQPMSLSGFENIRWISFVTLRWPGVLSLGRGLGKVFGVMFSS